MNRSAVRRWVARVGYRLGVIHAVTRAGDRWRIQRGERGFTIRSSPRESCLILIYHRVHREARPFSIETTSPEAFRGQMEHVARNFHVLPLGEMVRRLGSGEPIPRRSIAITFDDGYEDNYTEAYPILRELGLPATIFLTTGCIGTGTSPWFDRVLRAFENTTRDRVELPGGEEAAGLSDPARRGREAIRALYALMRLPHAEHVEAVSRLVADLLDGGTPPTPTAMLDWDQVRIMAAGGITFGAHTVSHAILSRMPIEEAEREILESKRRIEEETGTAVDLFAYPVGRRSDYSPEVVARLPGAGFRAAVTTTPGANGPGDDPFLLRRIKPLGEDVPSFALGLGVHYLTEWRGDR